MQKNSFPYFDNNATTPLDTRVLDILTEYQATHFANPSSTSHPLGMMSHALYKQHLSKIAEILQVPDSDLILTSGATESINTAIKGLYFQYQSSKNHLISCKTEHAAVLNTLQYLQKYHRAQITLLEVNSNGQISLEELEKSIQPHTLMVCLMAANNEIGVLHPLDEVYKICQAHKVLFFSDTTQLFGKGIFSHIPADIFCGSAHKFYGCKGIGFLVVRQLGRKIFLHPLIHGGAQQTYRSGTLPLPLIAALATALEIIHTNQQEKYNKIKIIRDYFETQMKQRFFVKIHAEDTPRIANTSNIQVPPNLYEPMLKLMKKFCYSHGSACSDGSGKPSHVLQSMGLTKRDIMQSFRFSFGHQNKKEEIDHFLSELQSLTHSNCLN